MSNKNVRRWYKNPAFIVPIIVAIIGAAGVIVAAYSDIFKGPDVSTVQGVVTDNDGMPVAGAVVEINGLSATTDACGVYVINDVPIGTKTVVVRAPGAEVTNRAIRITKGGEIIIYDILLPSLVTPAPSPTPTSTPSLEITYPTSGGMVEIKEIVRGTSQNIPEEQAIWVVIYPHEVNRYYPVNYPADVQLNGDWSSLAFIGIETDVGMTFDIIAVLADKEALDAFNDYLEECKENKSWPGLERLHEGAVICDRITVIRK